jgi:(E)-4-hydroxy-3-methylbut-2-enyl-diphosphate synthase
MAKTYTADAEATAAQVQSLAAAGAELVRLAVPNRQDTAALRRIVPQSPVPIVADVHFNPDRALEAIDAGAAKIRLNPGNISDDRQVRRIIAAAAGAGVAIRVGVNEGSVVDRTDRARHAAESARPLDELMVAKLGEYVEVFRQERFENLVLSAKSHDAFTTIAACREIARRWNYPIHLGVTHSGTPTTGAIRSAAALGALLSEGIGDTIRVSYAGDPLREVSAALELLYSLRLRARVGAELIACPTCGRARMDVVRLAEEVHAALADLDAPITVAVMGCVVNGPGEAANADVAICAGEGKAVLYRKGKPIGTVDGPEIVAAVVAEARRVAANGG